MYTPAQMAAFVKGSYNDTLLCCGVAADGIESCEPNNAHGQLSVPKRR